MPSFYRVIFIMRINDKPEEIKIPVVKPNILDKPKELTVYEKLVKQIKDAKQIPIA